MESGLTCLSGETSITDAGTGGKSSPQTAQFVVVGDIGGPVARPIAGANALDLATVDPPDVLILGSAVKGFRKAMSEADQDEPPKQINKQADADFTESRQNETAGKKHG